jgi:acetyl esterase/lipase
VRANAATFGIDPDRLTLWAFSGGGLLLSRALREAPSYLRSLVAYYAVLDTPPSVAGLTEDMLKELSPLRQLKSKQKGQAVPPLFIARAGQDNPALNGAMDRLVQEALARNLTLDLSNHVAGQRGFDVLNDDERTREIIRRTLDFIRIRN